jgi:hypothetical protein
VIAMLRKATGFAAVSDQAHSEVGRKRDSSRSERERRSFGAHSLAPDFWPGIASEYRGVIRYQWNSPTSMESTDKDHRVRSEFAPIVLVRKALVHCNVGRMVNPTTLQR